MMLRSKYNTQGVKSSAWALLLVPHGVEDYLPLDGENKSVSSIMSTTKGPDPKTLDRCTISLSNEYYPIGQLKFY